MHGHGDGDLAHWYTGNDPPVREADDRYVMAGGVVHKGKSPVCGVEHGEWPGADTFSYTVYDSMGGSVDESDTILATHGDGIVDVAWQDGAATGVLADGCDRQATLIPEVDNRDGAIVIVRDKGQPAIGRGRWREGPLAGGIRIQELKRGCTQEPQDICP
ncbi:MAG: hypothetical protein ACE5G1_07855, partial [bacterium]